MSGRPRVLVTSCETPQAGIRLLKNTCDVTVMNTRKASQQDVMEIIKNYDAMMNVNHVVVDEPFLDAAGPRLKVISTMSAGYDHLNVPEIKKRKIQVGNTPDVLSGAVAEIAVLLSLSAARLAHEGRQMLQEGKVESQGHKLLGHEMINSTVGIVGLGSIGIEIVKRLQNFGIRKFIYTGHSRKKSGDDLGAEFVTLDQLLHSSDFIIVSCPLTTETEGMFNEKAFNKMKSNCVFVNVSRGKIVKTDALITALKNCTIYAAGLDVTEPEPLPKEHELLQLNNAVILPHLGSATVETRDRMSITAAQNILNGLEGKPLIYPL